ncbi:MAG: tetratricopeptide repeat protein [Methyloligellaceae bacterium]
MPKQNILSSKTTRSALSTDNIEEEIERLMGRHKFADAIHFLDAARKANRFEVDDDFFHHNMSQIYFFSGKHLDALKNIESALQNRSTDKNKILLSRILCHLKRYKETIEIFESLFKENDSDLGLLHSGCIAHYKTGNVKKATEIGRRRFEIYDSVPANGPEVSTMIDGPKEGRKIISYSLWGPNPVFAVGGIINCILVRRLLPGWTPRFYVDGSVGQTYLTKIRQHGGEIVLADEEKKWIPPLFWRFLIADDEAVSAYLCRDCDSRPSVKEASAVLEWEASGHPFHVIRDHVFHCEPVLGGLWGGHTSVKLNMEGRIRAFLDQNDSYRLYGNDQRFLREKVWPDIKLATLAHDTFYKFYNSKKPPNYFPWSEEDHSGRCYKNMKDIVEEAKFYNLGLQLRHTQKVQAVTAKPTA